MKPRKDYVTYTPELIATLRTMTGGQQRATGVKILGQYLRLSPRQARAVYARYIEEGAEPLYPVEAATPTGSTRAPVSRPEGRKIRRLFIDLETSPNIGLFWRAGFKLNIDADNIIKERAIICAGYKWEGERKTHIVYWDKDQNDKALLEALLPIIAQADEVIAHNGNRFDVPWLRTRCLFHDLPPFPTVKTIDTLTWARRQFYFNSNKLDYIAKFLGMGGKIKTSFGLWKDIVLNKDAKALAQMLTYCMRDVELLERVWARLNKLVAQKTHVGVLAGGDKWTSPYTGTTNVKVSKTRVTAGGSIQYQMIDDAGRYYTISASAHAAYLAAKGR